MKEVLTKTFWQSVKKTYEDALNGVPEEDKKEDKAIEVPAVAPKESEHK